MNMNDVIIFINKKNNIYPPIISKMDGLIAYFLMLIIKHFLDVLILFILPTCLVI